MTEHLSSNDGVVIGGNAQVHGPVAGGLRARASQVNVNPPPDAARIAALRELETLVRLLKQRPDAPPQAHQAADEMQVVLTEQPLDPGRVTAALTRLTASVTAAAALAEAGGRVADAVSNLFS